MQGLGCATGGLAVAARSSIDRPAACRAPVAHITSSALRAAGEQAGAAGGLSFTAYCSIGYLAARGAPSGAHNLQRVTCSRGAGRRRRRARLHSSLFH